VGAITLLLDAGKDSGTIRPDVDADEVLLLVGFLWRIDADTDWEARSRHMVSLVMDGLRRTRPERSPGGRRSLPGHDCLPSDW